MDSEHFMKLSELFDQFRQQALLLLKDAEELGYLDELTNCYNRNAYNVRKEQLLILPNVNIIIVDVNGLKHVNDTLGHQAGDLLLRDLGKMLKAYFGGNNVFRVGGDEFIILKLSLNEVEFTNVVEEFKTAINTIHKTNIAIGYSRTTEIVTFNNAVKEAEKAMYDDKEKFYKSNPELKRN